MKLSECVETCMMNFFKKTDFVIKMRQYLNSRGEFLKVMELNYSFSRQPTDSKTKTFSS